MIACLKRFFNCQNVFGWQRVKLSSEHAHIYVLIFYIWNYAAVESLALFFMTKVNMDSPSLPMDVRDINVCLLSAKKKSTSSPSLRELDQISMR